MIDPININREQLVRSVTSKCIRRASLIYDYDFPLIPICFDLKGRAAGMYRVQNNDRVIRYNPFIFAKYFADNMTTTVPHEVAHYVVDMLYGANRVKPHGAEWRQVMLSLGVEPRATGSYDLSDIPVRRQQRHSYQCACTMHHITTVRHNKILQGKAHYFCRNCRTPLISVETKKE